MKKQVIRIITLAVITVIAVTFIYRSGVETIEGKYKVIGVNDKGIVIQMGSKQQVLRTTADIVQIVQIDHVYNIRFEKAPLQQPELDYIRLDTAIHKPTQLHSLTQT